MNKHKKYKPMQILEDRKETLASIKFIDGMETYNIEEELLRLLQTTPHDIRMLDSYYKRKK